MVGRSCFFVGHRETPPELLPVLTYAIEQHISEYGVTEFIVGGYGSFDCLAAHAVIHAKQQHPQILLLRLIPYYSEAQSIELPRGFDGTFYPPGMEKVPRRFAIPKANQITIDHSDYLIAYVCDPTGNSKGFLEYGMRREKRGLIKITIL